MGFGGISFFVFPEFKFGAAGANLPSILPT